MDGSSTLKRPREDSANSGSSLSVNYKAEQNQEEEGQPSPYEPVASTMAGQQHQQQTLNNRDLYQLILKSLWINQVLLLDRLGHPETMDDSNNELYRLRLLNQLMIYQLQDLLQELQNNTSYEPQGSRYDNDQHDEAQLPYQNLHDGLNNPLAHLSSLSSIAQNIGDFELGSQQQQQSAKCGKLIDPINYLPHDILIHIFSFIKVENKKESLNLMLVSKNWLNEIPKLTTRVWEYGTKLTKDFTLNQCLGTHVRSLEFDDFSQQNDLFEMMKTAENCKCTQLISTCFNGCFINDYQRFMKYLKPLTKLTLIVEFEYHQGVTLSISLILENCPNLQHLKYAAQNNEQHKQDYISYSQLETIPKSNIIADQQSSLYPLTNLTIGGDFDHMDHITPMGSNTNFENHELVKIIKRASHLETLILCHVGNNTIDSCVIYAIAGLPSLQKLGLVFELNANEKAPIDTHNVTQEQQQALLHMAFYALLAKHAALGSRNSLCDLTLNIVDDTILYQISRISSFVNLNLTDSLQEVTEQGILTFARELYSSGGAKNLVQLSLHCFDIQNYKVLCHFSHLKKLQVVDFSDCYLQKDGYKTLIDQSPSLEYIFQPLYDLHDVEAQKVTQIRTNDNDNASKPTLIPYKLMHHDDMAVPDYNMDSNRNKFIVMTEELEDDFELLISSE